MSRTRFASVFIACCALTSLLTLAGCNSNDGAQTTETQAPATVELRESSSTEPVSTSSSSAATTTAQTETKEEPPADPGPTVIRDTDRGAHYSQESLSISEDGFDDVYANWVIDDEGAWCAEFATNNGTVIHAYPVTDGSWVFFTTDGSEVEHMQISSDQFGQSGPNGVTSIWRDKQDHNVWY